MRVLNIRLNLARLGEIALVAWMLAGFVPTLGPVELVCPVASLAESAVDEGIGEPGHVTRCLPYGGVQDDRRVERDDVVPFLDHRLEPAVLHVLLQEDSVVPVVVRGT
jgi:hypothetical protein